MESPVADFVDFSASPLVIGTTAVHAHMDGALHDPRLGEAFRGLSMWARDCAVYSDALNRG